MVSCLDKSEAISSRHVLSLLVFTFIQPLGVVFFVEFLSLLLNILLTSFDNQLNFCP